MPSTTQSKATGKPPTTTFPLSDAPAAHHALETRQTTGKVVLLT
ncbi:zinc-binding dehydrogenase [Kribbella sp. NPDC026611]